MGRTGSTTRPRPAPPPYRNRTRPAPARPRAPPRPRAHVAHRLPRVPAAALARGADPRRPLADPPQRLAEVGGTADEGDLEGELVDVIALVGGSQHLRLVD